MPRMTPERSRERRTAPRRHLRTRIVDWLGGRRPWTIWAIALLLIAGFGAADFFIRRQLELSILYTVPVGLVTYYIGRRQGWLVSLLAAAVWTWANDLAGELVYPTAILTFNAAARLAMFVVVVVLLDALRHAFEGERELARTDPLTGAANYRAFAEQAEQELVRTRRYRRPLTLVQLDLDGFKEVNDRLGHEAGDDVLVRTVQALRGALRRTDLVARLGGDEFGILLPETAAEGARAVTEKLRGALDEAMRAGSWEVTGSFGALTCLDAPPTLEEMVRRADALMYRSKAAGRNRITHDIIAAQLVSVGQPASV